MSSSQKKELDRKKLFADPFLITVIAGIFLFLFLFILYPLSILLVDSMYVDSRFTLDVFFRILNMHSFKTAITNTLFLGMITGIAATLIGFLFAYVDAYVNTGSKAVKGLFNAVSILPVVSPPFVLSLSAILLFGYRYQRLAQFKQHRFIRTSRHCPCANAHLFSGVLSYA